MDFDLLLFLKEIQLQHGLRANDFARYHRYTTSRVRTLRQQLGLAPDPRRFQSPDLFPASPLRRPEHLQLLALYAERCWAAAESQQERRRAAARGETRPPGGLPPPAQHRKRLQKAAAWAERLRSAAEGAAPRLRRETEAYALEARGRAAAAHGAAAEAKALFIAAREAYYGLRAESSPAQQALLFAKITELDDRVVHCMMRLNEDPASYTLRVEDDDATRQHVATTVEWNGRQLRVASARVRDALREASAIDTESARGKALETRGAVISAGQQSRALDLTDRRVGFYNDALAHARQELRGIADGWQKTELQLIVHYLIFQAAFETLQRTLFMVEVHARRFRATEQALSQKQQQQMHLQPRGKGMRKRREIAPSQYVSPLEIVRLYDAALETLGEMELLPGVAGREDVDVRIALCRAGKLLYTGDAWRIAGDTARAQDCYAASRTILDDAPRNPQLESMRLFVEKAALQLASTTLLSSSSSGVPPAEPLQFLVNASDEVAAAQNVMMFPPDYQAVPCKPVFVDTASLYVDYPSLDGAAQSSEESGEPAAASAAASDKASKGWKWGWGWRKS